MTASILTVLTKDYLRRLWPGIALGVAGLVLIPFGIVEFLVSRGTTLDSDAFDPFVFHFTYVGVAYIAFAAAVAHAQTGLRHRLYALPISSAAIAGWLMVSGALTVAIANIVTCWLYSISMSLHWPVLGPTLFMVLFITVLQSASWSLLDFRLGRLGGWLAIIAGLMFWFACRYQPHGFSSRLDAWFHVTPWEWSVMVTACVVAAWYGVRCLTRHRRGEVAAAHTLEDVSAGIEDRIRERTAGKTVEEFASPLAAFRWFEWRRTRAITLTCGCLVAPFLCLGVWFDSDSLGPHRLEEFAAIMTMLPIWSGGIIGVTLIIKGRDPHNHRMPTFFATLPLSDRQLARGLMQNASRTSMTVWATIVALGMTTLLARLIRDGFTFSGDHGNSGWLADLPLAVTIPVLFAVSLLGHWTLVCLVAAALWTGRGKVLSYLTTGLICLAVATIFIVKFVIPESSQETVETAIFITLSACVFAGTLFAFASARRREFIGSRTVGLAVLAWGVLATAGWLILRPEPLAGAVACGLLALCVLPWPAAPLAVSWNRHG